MKHWGLLLVACLIACGANGGGDDSSQLDAGFDASQQKDSSSQADASQTNDTGSDVVTQGCGTGTCFPVLDLCLTCSCNTAVTGHLADQLETASKTWKFFGESMGTACNYTDTGSYAARHNPFVYYDNVRTNASRCSAHVVDYK